MGFNSSFEGSITLTLSLKTNKLFCSDLKLLNELSPSGSTRFVWFAYALSFPSLAVVTALTLCPVLSHTNSVYGAIHCALLLKTFSAASGYAVLRLCPFTTARIWE
jgi:hypothetical protein